MYASIEKLAMTGLVFIVSFIVGAAAFTYFAPSDADKNRTGPGTAAWKRENERKQEELSRQLKRDQQRFMQR